MNDIQKDKKKQRISGTNSFTGGAVYAGTTLGVGTALGVLGRNSAITSMLVNTTLPMLGTAAIVGGALDAGASVAKLITSIPGRNRCYRIVKGMKKVDTFLQIKSPTTQEKEDYDKFVTDVKKHKMPTTKKFLRFIPRPGIDNSYDSEWMYGDILRERLVERPNELQKDLLNDLNFRDIPGVKLPETVDYSLSVAYNVLRLKNIISKALSIDAAGNASLKSGEEGLLDNDAQAEVVRLQRQLGHLGLGDMTGEDLVNINKAIDIYLKPLGNNANFLNNYLLRGDTYQNFATLLVDESSEGHNLVMRLMDAQDKREPGFKVKMIGKAVDILSDIEELKLQNIQKVALRKKFKWSTSYEPEFLNKDYTYAEDATIGKNEKVKIGKQTCQRLEAIALKRRIDEIKPRITNGYVTVDWLVDVLTSEAKGRISRKQRSLAFKIIKEAGINKRDVKKILKNGGGREDLTSLLNNNDGARKVINNIAKGINLTSSDSITTENKQYLITDNYNLKILKKGKSKFSRYSKAEKLVAKYLPEYNKVRPRSQLMPISRAFFKHASLRTYLGAALGVTVGLAGLLTGAALPAILGYAAGGLGVLGLTIADKAHEIRTGKKFLFLRTKKTRELEELRDQKINSQIKHMAPSRSVTTSRFRNEIIKSDSGNFITKLFKRVSNAMGGKRQPNADRLFAANGPASFMEAYGVPNSIKEQIYNCLTNAIKLGLKQNSEIRYLEEPIEIYVRDSKGKVQSAYHIDQKNLANDLLPILLREHAGKADSNFDVRIGKAKFRIQPSEIKDGRIEQTARDIIGYSQEEQFTRSMPKLYEFVKRDPERFGIIVKNIDGVDTVVSGYSLATAVNNNAPKYNKGDEQVFKRFAFGSISAEAKKGVAVKAVKPVTVSEKTGRMVVDQTKKEETTTVPKTTAKINRVVVPTKAPVVPKKEEVVEKVKVAKQPKNEATTEKQTPIVKASEFKVSEDAKKAMKTAQQSHIVPDNTIINGEEYTRERKKATSSYVSPFIDEKPAKEEVASTLSPIINGEEYTRERKKAESSYVSPFIDEKPAKEEIAPTVSPIINAEDLNKTSVTPPTPPKQKSDDISVFDLPFQTTPEQDARFDALISKRNPKVDNGESRVTSSPKVSKDELLALKKKYESLNQSINQEITNQEPSQNLTLSVLQPEFIGNVNDQDYEDIVRSGIKNLIDTYKNASFDENYADSETVIAKLAEIYDVVDSDEFDSTVLDIVSDLKSKGIFENSDCTLFTKKDGSVYIAKKQNSYSNGKYSTTFELTENEIENLKREASVPVAQQTETITFETPKHNGSKTVDAFDILDKIDRSHKDRILQPAYIQTYEELDEETQTETPSQPYKEEYTPNFTTPDVIVSNEPKPKRRKNEVAIVEQPTEPDIEIVSLNDDVAPSEKEGTFIFSDRKVQDDVKNATSQVVIHNINVNIFNTQQPTSEPKVEVVDTADNVTVNDKRKKTETQESTSKKKGNIQVDANEPVVVTIRNPKKERPKRVLTEEEQVRKAMLQSAKKMMTAGESDESNALMGSTEQLIDELSERFNRVKKYVKSSEEKVEKTQKKVTIGVREMLDKFYTISEEIAAGDSKTFGNDVEKLIGYARDEYYAKGKGTRSQLTAIRERLRSLGYREKAIREILALDDIEAIKIFIENSSSFVNGGKEVSEEVKRIARRLGEEVVIINKERLDSGKKSK